MAYYHSFLVTCGLILLLREISGLNSKLDFGDDSKPSIVSNNQRSIPFKYEHVRVDSIKNDDLDKIGTVCTTNCDKKSDHGKPTVETDVVVHVKSSVSIGNSSKAPEEVPDIPIVLGTKGSGALNEPHQGVQRGLQFQPISRSFQQSSPTFTPVNIHNAFPSLTPLVPQNLNAVNGVEYNSRNFHGAIDLPDGYKYRTGGLEIKVPYFEPTYHKHYYGEDSPPQFAYYPVKKAFRNPVAFNNIARPVYSFSSRNLPIQSGRHGENCTCQNHASGLSWYPSASSHIQRLTQGRSNNLQGGIDDKLAPLN